MEPIGKTAQGYVGMPIKRREDVRFITGAATYVDDIKIPNMLHAAVPGPVEGFAACGGD